MKNVILIFVFLLMVNCTTDSSSVLEPQNQLSVEAYNCVDDLPQVKVTNNGTFDFDLIIYSQEDLSEIYEENLSISNQSEWIELPNNDILIVVNNVDYGGHKIELTTFPCESVEVEIDINNVLSVLGI